MKILIIGGTRFVGHYTALELREAGHEVTVFTRGRHSIDLPGDVTHIAGDRENEADLRGAAGAEDWDVVWDNMSYTAAHARAAVRVFENRCRLFLHTSTLAVYSVCEGILSPYHEQDFHRGRPLYDRREIYPYDYGLQRREGEQVLQAAFEERGFPFVTLRLPAVLGPRDYSLRAWAYWRRILDGEWLILPDGGREAHGLVYSGDVVDAVVAVMERGRDLAGRAYNLGGAEIISLRAFVEISAEMMEQKVELLDIPASLLEATGIEPEKLSPYSTWANHLHAIERAQRDLGFEPTPMKDWLYPTIEWHMENRRDAEPPGWELRDAENRLGRHWLDLIADFVRAAEQG